MICLKHAPAHRIRGTIRMLLADRRGAALIEFAMVLPVLITLYLGGFQVMEATSVYRKVSTSARSLADLSTQKTSLDETRLQKILDASAQIMAPYSAARGYYRVSLIEVNENTGAATVAWSKSKDGSEELVVGSTYALPANVKRNGVGIVVCDVRYTYTPIALFSLIGDIPFKDQIFMVPRGNSTIILQN
jgi:Flp pilus assembly protein TadG